MVQDVWYPGLRVNQRVGGGAHSPSPRERRHLFRLGGLQHPRLEAGCLLEYELLQPLLGQIIQLHVKGERFLGHWLGWQRCEAQARP